MPITEEMQELIVVGDLLGKHATLIFKDLKEIEGTIHSISNHGVLIKTEEAIFELYPWWQIQCVMHRTKPIEKELEEPETKSREIEITESDLQRIQNLIPTDYETEEDGSDINVCDADGDLSIYYNQEKETIYIANENDLDLAKSIAREFGIKRVVRDY